MLHAILLVSIVSLFTIADVSAQTTTARSEGFRGLALGRTIVVVDELGRETRGRLVRFTPDTLMMLVASSEVSVDRRRVASVYTRGDSIWNGMAIGAAAGAVLGVTSLQASRTQGDLDQAAAGILPILGAGIGTALDAVIRRKRVVYERQPGQTTGAALSLLPAVGASRAGLSMRMSW